jgi:hypothetical protein
MVCLPNIDLEDDSGPPRNERLKVRTSNINGDLRRTRENYTRNRISSPNAEIHFYKLKCTVKIQPNRPKARRLEPSQHIDTSCPDQTIKESGGH